MHPLCTLLPRRLARALLGRVGRRADPRPRQHQHHLGLAQGVVDAAKEINLSVPLVVRLAGTNFKEGKEILEKSNLKILSASDLNDAAKKIVEAIK